MSWVAGFIDFFPAYAPLRYDLRSWALDEDEDRIHRSKDLEARDLNTAGWVLNGQPSLEQYDEPVIKPESEEMKSYSVEGANHYDQPPKTPLYSPEPRYSVTRVHQEQNAPRPTDELVITSMHQFRFTDEVMIDVDPRHSDELEERPVFWGSSAEAGSEVLPRPRRLRDFENL
jgi:hypothetical protein